MGFIQSKRRVSKHPFPGRARVQWPHLRAQKVWMLVLATPTERSPNALKLSAIDISNSIYKTCVSEFWYRWPKVMSILRPLCSTYKSTGENWKASLLHEHYSKYSQTSGYRWTWHPEPENCDQWPLIMSLQDHLRSLSHLISFIFNKRQNKHQKEEIGLVQMQTA